MVHICCYRPVAPLEKFTKTRMIFPEIHGQFTSRDHMSSSSGSSSSQCSRCVFNAYPDTTEVAIHNRPARMHRPNGYCTDPSPMRFLFSCELKPRNINTPTRMNKAEIHRTHGCTRDIAKGNVNWIVAKDRGRSEMFSN